MVYFWVLLAAKLFVSVVFVVWFFVIYRMVDLGRDARLGVTSAAGRHERFAVETFWATIILVICAEGLHLLATGRVGGETGTLFQIHLPFAIALLTGITLMRFFFNGKKHQLVHRLLAKIVRISFLVVAVTGPLLLWQM